jgi:hypothetical protein
MQILEIIMPRYAFFGVTTTVDVVVVVTEVTLSQATRHHPQRNLLYVLRATPTVWQTNLASI